nr:unnamed protein product [Callosobruchus analis]
MILNIINRYRSRKNHLYVQVQIELWSRSSSGRRRRNLERKPKPDVNVFNLHPRTDNTLPSSYVRKPKHQRIVPYPFGLPLLFTEHTRYLLYYLYYIYYVDCPV